MLHCVSEPLCLSESLAPHLQRSLQLPSPGLDVRLHGRRRTVALELCCAAHPRQLSAVLILQILYVLLQPTTTS